MSQARRAVPGTQQVFNEYLLNKLNSISLNLFPNKNF